MPTRTHDLRKDLFGKYENVLLTSGDFHDETSKISSASELLDENLYHTKKTSDDCLFSLALPFSIHSEHVPS